jgi:hypothetical protein|tara:strand:- start:318 stop:614 length:297 start_codon:yes stop_codon:yes gene_type:complete
MDPITYLFTEAGRFVIDTGVEMFDLGIQAARQAGGGVLRATGATKYVPQFFKMLWGVYDTTILNYRESKRQEKQNKKAYNLPKTDESGLVSILKIKNP